ncbi:MAG: ABC transporter ATP-binding protein [Chloroflexota bacterium]
MSDKKPILQVKNLTVKFGSFTAVDDVSFDLHHGETLAIVGESGSGKSVTAMSIMRLVALGSRGRITNGEILLHQDDGSVIDLVKQPERVMRSIRGNHISMIFQEPLTSLNPVYTVGDQIMEAIILHQDASRADAQQRALDMLKRVRIPEAEKQLTKYPHELSGGMRQRVMIAMALSCGPAILIADEPTTALDVTIQAQILGLMRELQEETGTAVIMITHDMGVVAEISDRALVMNRGKLVESGDVFNIFDRPVEPYTQALLQAVPRLGSMAESAVPVRFQLVDDALEAMPVEKMPDYTEKPLLEVTDLYKKFPLAGGAKVHAVENVSLQIIPGETLAVVGESGCGKSTLANVIMKLHEPTAGSVKLNGVEIANLNRAEMRDHRQQMQMIFQDPFASLDPRRRVGDSVARPMRIHKMGTAAEIRERVTKLFKQVGLDESHQNLFPHQFSGGQRQRICIARALALNPKLLIADEAVSALDVSIQAQVINLMLDLQQDLGLSFLFISHDMAVVERISHRVAVMYLGQIVEIGPRQEIFANPSHSYTKKLLSAVPIADPKQRKDRPMLTGEIPSPIWPADESPELVTLREVGPGHLVAVE